MKKINWILIGFLIMALFFLCYVQAFNAGRLAALQPSAATSTQYYLVVIENNKLTQVAACGEDLGECMYAAYSFTLPAPTSTNSYLPIDSRPNMFSTSTVQTWSCLDFGGWNDYAVEFEPGQASFPVNTIGSQTPKSLGFSDCTLTQPQ